MADPRDESSLPDGDHIGDHTDDQLVAYLDGELDADSTSAIEARLATDVDCRHRLRELEKAWSLLDELPRASVGETFTRSTIEMVAIAAEGDLIEAKGTAARRGRRRMVLAAVAVLVVAATGFAATRWVLPHANDALLTNLSVIENLDFYQQAPSVAFLESLAAEKLFPQETEVEAQLTPAAAATDEEARERVLAMSGPEQERLRSKQQRFENLDAAERDRLRTLDRQIREHAKRDELWRVMVAYHGWLKTLSPDERTRLQQPDPDERLNLVRKRRQEQQKREVERPREPDRKAIMAWLDDFITRHENEIIETSTRKEHLSSLAGEERNRELRTTVWSRIAGGRMKPPITDDDFTKLASALSPTTRSALTEAKTHEAREKILQGWVREMSRHLWHRGGPWGRRTARFSPASEAELKEFMNTLPQAERDKIWALPVDEMQRTLQRMWAERKQILDSLPKEERDKLLAMPPDEMQKEIQRLREKWFRERGPGGPGRDGRPGGRRDDNRDGGREDRRREDRRDGPNRPGPPRPMA